MGKKVKPFVDQFLILVWEYILFMDLSIPSIHTKFTKDVRKLAYEVV
jgi:hypothetical protein